MFEKRYRASIEMKSGKTITLRNLKEIAVKKVGNRLTEVSWDFPDKDTTILYLNIDEIDAVVVERQ